MSNEQRQQQLEKNLQEAYELLGSLEQEILYETRPIERRRLEHQRDEKTQQIAALKAQLSGAGGQTPASGSSAPPPIAPSAAPPTGATPRDLTFQEFSSLVNLLLACPSLGTPAGRGSTVSNLPSNIRNAINYSPTANAKQDLNNIVQGCLNYPNGWKALLEIVEFYDGGSLPWQSLQNYLTQHNLNPT